MATVPLSGTNIRLLKGVPFHSDYKHTRWFDTKSQQTSYFLSKDVVHYMSQANFQKIEGKNFIAVNKDIDSLWGVNYVMFQNAQYSNKWFYGFVTQLEYVQRNTTYVHFSIDVFQTWRFEWEFKPSFVVREHCKLWNSDGTPVINTVDEGLNYGSDYDTVYEHKYVPMNWYKWLVVVSKTVLHEGSNKGKIIPTVIGTPQPLSYYLIPFKDNQGVPPYVYGYNQSGEDYMLVDSVTECLKALFTNSQAVNNVVSMYVTDHIGVDTSVTENGSFPDHIKLLNDVSISEATIREEGTSNQTVMLYVNRISQFNPTSYTVNTNKYSSFRSVKESKLLMYPYSMTVLNDYKGNMVEIKNEYIGSNRLELFVQGSLGTSNKVSYSVKKYNNNFSDTVDRYISLENGLINNNPNELSVMNDYLASYLQGNRNTIQHQRKQAISDGVYKTLSGIITGVTATETASQVAGTIQASKGLQDTVLKLQGINAKIKDIDNIPPQLTNMGGNTAFEFGNKYNGVWILKKQLKPEYQKKLEHFFNMFGYKVNEVKVPNFHTRKYWNYVQTESCIVTGDFNNEDLQEIKNVFDNGITLWHTDDIGNYSLNNEVL